MKNRFNIRGTGSAWIALVLVAGIALIVAVNVDGTNETVTNPANQEPASDASTGTISTLAGNDAVTKAASATVAPEYPPAQGTTVAQEMQAMSTARADPNSPTKSDQPMPPTEDPDSTPPPLQAGIVNGVQQGPFSSGQFKVRNFWQGPTEHGWMLVYAGVTRSVADGTLGPGALRVYSVTTGAPEMATSVPAGRQVTLVGIFTATTSEPLKIVTVNGGVLDLRSDSGQTFTFNLQTLEFL